MVGSSQNIERAKIIGLIALSMTFVAITPSAPIVPMEKSRPPDIAQNLSMDGYEIPGWGRNQSLNTKDYVSFKRRTEKLVPRFDKGGKKHAPSLLIAVQTDPRRPSTRAAIRATSGRDCLTRPDCDVLFVMGEPEEGEQEEDKDDIQKTIDTEATEFGDILQEDFIDSYNNLTLKALFSLKYFYNSTKIYSHILKVNDDTFFNVPAVFNLIQGPAITTNGSDIIGYPVSGSKPKRTRNGDLKEDRYHYEPERYPNYLTGGGYIMNRKAARCIYERSFQTDILFIEDVFITGILGSQCAQIVFYSSTFLNNLQSFSDFHSNRTAIAHQVQDSDWPVLHKMVKERTQKKTHFSKKLQFWTDSTYF